MQGLKGTLQHLETKEPCSKDAMFAMNTAGPNDDARYNELQPAVWDLANEVRWKSNPTSLYSLANTSTTQLEPVNTPGLQTHNNDMQYCIQLIQ